MSAPRIRWRRLSMGLNLIGVGVFLMLTTQGLLPWSYWLDAVVLWPVLLIGLGLRLVFERSRTPWLVLASPLLIQGTLAYVALRPAASLTQDWHEVRADRPEGTQRWSLDADLAVARVVVHARDLSPDVLVRGRSAWRDRRPRVSVSERSNGQRVRLRSSSEHLHLWPRERQSWQLDVARDLPLDADLDYAFVQGELDLRDAPVERLWLDGAFNDVVVTLGVPEHDVRVDLDGAFDDYRLLVPAGTPVRVVKDGALLDVDGRDDASRLAGPGYQLRFRGFASQLEVRSLEGVPSARVKDAEAESPP